MRLALHSYGDLPLTKPSCLDQFTVGTCGWSWQYLGGEKGGLRSTSFSGVLARESYLTRVRLDTTYWLNGPGFHSTSAYIIISSIE